MMLMLKMLMLKMFKKYINIYIYIYNIYDIYIDNIRVFLAWMTQNKEKALFSLQSLKQNNFQKNKKKKDVRCYQNL